MSDMPATVSSTTMQVLTIQPSISLATISPDEKTICVDWAEVEKQAQGNDPYLRPLAKLLISVRDKTFRTPDPQ